MLGETRNLPRSGSAAFQLYTPMRGTNRARDATEKLRDKSGGDFPGRTRRETGARVAPPLIDTGSRAPLDQSALCSARDDNKRGVPPLHIYLIADRSITYRSENRRGALCN